MTPAQGSSRSATLANVQGLRAVAALLVVLVHLEQLLNASGLATGALPFAALGVDLFFVISGYVMVYTTDPARVSGWTFLRARIARIVPLYWLVTLVVFGLAVAAPAAFAHTRPSWIDLFRSLTFIPYMRWDGNVMPVFFLGWSLNYEMFFYLVFAVTLLIKRRALQVSLAILFICGLVAIGMVHPWPPGTSAAFYSSPRMLEFVAGMLIGIAYPSLPGSRLAGALAILAGFVGLAATPWLVPSRDVAFGALGACSLVLVGALMAERGGLRFAWRPLVRCGDASYSLYLIHPFITQAATLAWQYSGGGKAMAQVALLCVFPLVVGSALACFALVEMPLVRVARRLLGQPARSASIHRHPVPALEGPAGQ